MNAAKKLVAHKSHIAIAVMSCLRYNSVALLYQVRFHAPYINLILLPVHVFDPYLQETYHIQRSSKIILIAFPYDMRCNRDSSVHLLP